MKILCTVPLSNDLKKKQQEKFPNQTFIYNENLAQVDDLEVFDVLVTFGKDVTESFLKKASQLKWIMIFAAGINHLPKEALSERDIIVSNAKGAQTVPLAEFVIAFMLNHVKSLPAFAGKQAEHIWDNQIPITELAEKTIAIAGTGSIGSKIAQFAENFSMHTIGFNTSGHKVEHFHEVYSIDELLNHIAETDFFVSILPGTEETEYLYKDSFFKKLKADAVFINMGRGVGRLIGRAGKSK